MSFSIKENEEDARERLRAFWEGSSMGRPALHVTAAKPEPENGPCPFDGLSLKEKDLLPEWHARQADLQLNNTIYLAEAMPAATIGFGSLLVTAAALAGANYHYVSNSAWIEEIPGLWERPLPQFDASHPVAGKLEKCVRKVAETVGDRGFVNPPVMLDAITNLSQFRTPEQLCLDVVERPCEVCEWCDALTSLYIECHDHFYRLVCELGYGDTSAWLCAMAEGKFEAAQCDFSVMLSPGMFDRLIMPDLRRMTDSMDFSLYHLDGVCQLRFLDSLCSLPKLNGIQWNPEPGECEAMKWLEAFREIRKRKLCLHIGCTVEEAVMLTRELGPDGLLLVLPRFESREDAEQAIQDIKKAS
ncbi:MAG: hypothetical protein QF437_01005 [Planctomycetota bacterium]|jgi:hypothetical protein|nr:hypothetical protein [Planctomycetota bacterium]MDP7129037.1 hypothetical protein [Planctomycetota bacterium]MDP7250274.1 hypothetical protein [Planctomycetota bacterium]